VSLSCVFDIETAPLDESTVLARVGQFDEMSYIAAKHPGEFNPDTVKVGNLKDADKIAAKVEEAKAAHAASVKEFNANIPWAASEYAAAAMDKAALSAITGRVIAIGLADGKGEYLHFLEDFAGKAYITDDAREMGLIANFWDIYESTHTEGGHLVGVNITKFDLPFLCQRSMLLGVKIPDSVLERGRYWSATFVDLCQLWMCGNPNGYVSFDVLCKAFDLPGKEVIEVGDEIIEGKNFHKFSRSDDPAKREAARRYLLGDITQPRELAKRMGIF